MECSVCVLLLEDLFFCKCDFLKLVGIDFFGFGSELGFNNRFVLE